jgi:hypothetical protein
MKVAIMQPYFFPYIGYFQLIHAVDIFVIYDDVSYIKRGWVNRNNLLSSGGQAELITLETSGASQNKLINEVGVGGNRRKLLKNIAYKYSRAPYFKQVYPLIDEVLGSRQSNLSLFLTDCLKALCEYLTLNPEWRVSSRIDKASSLKGQGKILAICEAIGATQYINLPGGKALYDKSLFADRGIELSFIQGRCQPYAQFGLSFVPSLSIIDVMMFNDRDHCIKLLEAYSLE